MYGLSDPEQTYQYAMTSNIVLGSWAGAVAAPRRHRNAAAFVFIGIAVLIPLALFAESAITGSLKPENYIELTGAVIGAAIALPLLRYAYA